jgi:hypothetical protein
MIYHVYIIAILSTHCKRANLYKRYESVVIKWLQLIALFQMRYKFISLDLATKMLGLIRVTLCFCGFKFLEIQKLTSVTHFNTVILIEITKRTRNLAGMDSRFNIFIEKTSHQTYLIDL